MNDKMREEFETWSTEDNQIDPMWLMRCGVDPEKYGILTVQKEWEIWQASRAAIRVDLPHLFPFYRQGVTEALHAYGIKVNQWGSK